MTSLAVLVEDDAEQASESIEILERVGFSVRWFEDIESVLSFLDATADLIDIFVLDRRLPVRTGEVELDELGDELRDRIDELRPGCRMIVFTGHSSVSHVQQSIEKRGQLFADSSGPIDRVTVLEKTQSIEFEERLVEFFGRIQLIDDIEIKCESQMEPYMPRVLRRVAYEFQGDSVSADPLEGGLTGADVWRCDVRANSVPVGQVVAKVVGARSVPGGLQDLLPPQNAARSVRTLSGLTGGRHINVLQYAGSEARSLLEIMQQDAAAAAAQVRKLKELFAQVTGQDCTLSISEVCDPFLDWTVIVDRLQARAISVPSATRRTSVSLGSRHGDLHPANVLVVSGEPVIIDFDSSCKASGLVDPVVLLISTLVHPKSPIKGAGWPPIKEIEGGFGERGFGQGHSQEDWFLECWTWIQEAKRGDREFWALVLAYCVRQLGYSDVLGDAEIMQRTDVLIRKACSTLAAL